MDKSFLINLVDSLTNTTQLTWTRLHITDDVLVQMKSQMTATALMFLVMTMSVVSFIVLFLIRELYTLLTMKSLKDKVVSVASSTLMYILIIIIII